MRARWLVPVCLVALFGCDTESATTPLAPQFAKGGGGGGGQPVANPVTSTIADGGAYQIQSDGAGAYESSSTLVSEIQGIGDWVVDALNTRGAIRQVSLDLTQPTSGTGLGNGAPIVVSFRAISRCSLNGLSFLTLAPGASMACPPTSGSSTRVATTRSR